jgi:L-ascorbate metabolism protein UlaG (beta-lactamase superfamily)
MGPWTIYHSGDTVEYAGLEDRLRPYRIDLALLPINGRAPERRVAGNLSGPEAAGLARRLGVGLVIPCHYDMFRFNTVIPEEFVADAARLRQQCRVLRHGEYFCLRVIYNNP